MSPCTPADVLLLLDVVSLVDRVGIDRDLDRLDQPRVMAAACQLLRAFGVEPVLSEPSAGVILAQRPLSWAAAGRVVGVGHSGSSAACAFNLR
jgi:hypothetical protein